MSEIRKPWTHEQDEAVKIIVRSLGTRKWSAVSQSMVDDYGLKGRSGKQCRERWHNHLDPDINRKPWTSKQEKIIFQAHKKYGNKWTDIAQLLDSRTDNAVKNHFYSTIRRSLRRISKTLGEKNSTSQMRDVKPSVLSEIFHYAQLPQSQQNLQNQKIVNSSLSESILEFASLKSCVRDEPLNQTDRQKLQLLYENLMKFKQLSINKKTQNFSSEIQISQSITPISESQTVKKKQLNYSLNSFKQNRTFKTQKKKISLNKNRTIVQHHHHQKSIIKQSIYDWDLFQKNCQIVQSFVSEQYRSKIPSYKILPHEQPNTNSFFFPLQNRSTKPSNQQNY